MEKKIVILGGGVAGIAAAIRLVERGYRVRLIDKRPVLGGRASSFIDPVTLEHIDNGQHILMKCCRHLLDLYNRLGIDEHIQWYDEFQILGPDNRISKIYSSKYLPSPFHLIPSLWNLKYLNFRDRLGIFYGIFLMMTQDENLYESRDQMTVRQWLCHTGQTDQAVDFFWRPFLVSALNEEIEFISVKYAYQFFRTGLFKNRDFYHMGVPDIPLSELYTRPVIDFLESYQSDVILKKLVTRVEFDGNKISHLMTTDGLKITGHDYILAVPIDTLTALLPGEIIKKYDYFTQFGKLEYSPILGIHLWFDQEITDLDHLAITGHTIQWMFNKTRNYSKRNKRSQNSYYYNFVISAGRNLINKSREEILDISLDEIKRIFPLSRDAKILKTMVIKEPKATFSPRPGTDNLRLKQETPIPNLLVAGDWTDTGWPGTMESAVISGYRAAESIILRSSGKDFSHNLSIIGFTNDKI